MSKFITSHSVTTWASKVFKAWKANFQHTTLIVHSKTTFFQIMRRTTSGACCHGALLKTATFGSNFLHICILERVSAYKLWFERNKGKYFGRHSLLIPPLCASSILFLPQVIWILVLFHHGWRKFWILHFSNAQKCFKIV